jgi:hypothetical protein
MATNIIYPLKYFPELKREIPKLYNDLILFNSANAQYVYLCKLYNKNKKNYTPLLNRIILAAINYLKECII